MVCRGHGDEEEWGRRRDVGGAEGQLCTATFPVRPVRSAGILSCSVCEFPATCKSSEVLEEPLSAK